MTLWDHSIKPERIWLVPMRWLPETVRGVAATVCEWRRRSRSRAELAGLDERLLRDIGVTRCDAWQEINKPFWRK